MLGSRDWTRGVVKVPTEGAEPVGCGALGLASPGAHQPHPSRFLRCSSHCKKKCPAVLRTQEQSEWDVVVSVKGAV